MEKTQLSKNSYILYDAHFLGADDLDLLREDLLNNSRWRDDKIQMFGKVFDQPRKVAFFGDEHLSYTYSKIKMKTQGWSSETKELTQKINIKFDLSFNSALLNYYRNGDDYMSWHCDNEPELGEQPVIASISIGQVRDFLFREKKNPKNKYKIKLDSGSLLLMMGDIQNEFHHALPKRKTQFDSRINLTFRHILTDE